MTSDRHHAPPALRAIVADDDPLARRLIKDALRQSGFTVVAEAHTGREAVELTLHYRPDIVLMDVVMPEIDGLEATRRIIKEVPDQIIVMLTTGDDEDVALVALRSGACGYLTKDLDVDVLPRALMSALDGEAAISRRLGMRLIEQLRRAPAGAPGLRPVKSPLTVREWEVIDLLEAGQSTETMAQTLVLSVETVRTHLKNIHRKLGVRTREDALAVARRMRGDLLR
jgi:DNA-binding NarL/FixJ family response regulator